MLVPTKHGKASDPSDEAERGSRDGGMRRDSPSTKPKAGKSHPCHSFAGPAPDKGGPSKQPWVWRSPGPPKHRPSQAPLLLLTLNPVSRIREFPHSNESNVWGSASHESPFLAENKHFPDTARLHPQVTVTQRSRGHFCPAVGQAGEHKAGVPGTSRATTSLTCAPFQEFSKTGRSGRKLIAWPLQATPGTVESRRPGTGGGRCPP